MPRRLLLSLLVPALLVAGCGGDDDPVESGDTTETTDAQTTTTAAPKPPDPADEALLADLEVTPGAEGAAPTLTFDQPFAVGTTVRRILAEGEGEEAEDGSRVTFDFIFLNGRDGSEITSSYGVEPATVTVDQYLLPGVRIGLLGLAPGSRAVVGIAPAEGFAGQGDDETTGVKEDDSLLLYVEVKDVTTPLARAQGVAVEPAEGLPTVELDGDGQPAIEVPDDDAPAELVTQLLIEGEGAVVESGQSITVHYTGVLWDGGEQFDSSWDRGTPATFTIGTGAVIAGWDKGLVGQKIGSQVLLVIPPADAYKEAGQGDIPGGATLVFVVDILDAR